MREKLIAISVVLTAIFLSETQVHAQLDTMNSRRSPAMSRDMRYREWQLKELEKSGRKPSIEEQRFALQQIKEDYEEIQISNSAFIKHLKENDQPDEKVVSRLMSDIKKRAARLLTTLGLPEKEDTEIASVKDMMLPSKIKILNGLIIHFIKNPMFSEVQVLKPEDALQARKDLELIILYSDNIKKNLTNPPTIAH